MVTNRPKSLVGASSERSRAFDCRRLLRVYRISGALLPELVGVGSLDLDFGLQRCGFQGLSAFSLPALGLRRFRRESFEIFIGGVD